LLYFFIKLAFSYTIIAIPTRFVSQGHDLRIKYFFPICIINPIKIWFVKQDVLYNLENFGNIEEFNQHSVEAINVFFGSLESLSDFDIISAGTYVDGIHPLDPDYGSYEYFLLQAKNSNKKCVVFRDIKSKKILWFRN
jgi:hypothetical protein